MRGECILVQVVRGAEIESAHRVHGLVVGLRDGEEAQFGDPDTLAFWRSALKPFQALPLVEDGAASAFHFGPRELALCGASHRGTPVHLEIAEAMLARVGLTERALACGPHPPFDEAAAHTLARQGKSPGRLHNNCSGKHIGMLALASHHGWPTEGYVEYSHPVQRRVRRALDPWLDVASDEVSWGVDGCGVPTPYLSLRQMARAYARLARSESPAVRAVVEAMTAHPEVVSGEGGIATAFMRGTGGRLLAKEGAEGIFCLCAPGDGWGTAIKVLDGAKRAVGPATVEMLTSLSLLTPSEMDALDDVRRPSVRNTQGREVGRLTARAHPRPAAVAGRL